MLKRSSRLLVCHWTTLGKRSGCCHRSTRSRQQTISQPHALVRLLPFRGYSKSASVRAQVNADVLVHRSHLWQGRRKRLPAIGHSTNMQAAQVAAEAGPNDSCSAIWCSFRQRLSSQLKKDAATILKTSMVKDLEEVKFRRLKGQVQRTTDYRTSGGSPEMVKLLPSQLILLGRNKEKLGQLWQIISMWVDWEIR